MWAGTPHGVPDKAFLLELFDTCMGGGGREIDAVGQFDVCDAPVRLQVGQNLAVDAIDHRLE